MGYSRWMFSVDEVKQGVFIVHINSEEIKNPFVGRRWFKREDADKAIEDYCKKYQPREKY